MKLHLVFFKRIYHLTFSIIHVKSIKLLEKGMLFEASKITSFFVNDNTNMARKDR